MGVKSKYLIYPNIRKFKCGFESNSNSDAYVELFGLFEFMNWFFMWLIIHNLFLICCKISKFYFIVTKILINDFKNVVEIKFIDYKNGSLNGKIESDNYSDIRENRIS